MPVVGKCIGKRYDESIVLRSPGKTIMKTRIKIIGLILLCVLLLVCLGLLKKRTGSKDANLFGNPEKNSLTVDGLMNSKENTVCRFSGVSLSERQRGADTEESEAPPERDVYYGKAFQNHVHISSDAGLGVMIGCADSKGLPDHLLMYVFKYSDDYEWKKEGAYITSIGEVDSSILVSLDEPDSGSTGVCYFFETNLPKDMPAGKYTIVIVDTDELFKPEEVKYPDGTVLAMVDLKVQ